MIKALYRLRDDGGWEFVAAFNKEEINSISDTLSYLISSHLKFNIPSGFKIIEFSEPNMPSVYTGEQTQNPLP